MYTTLQDFLAALEQRGELRRVSAPVSPILEISAIADRMSRTRAPRIGVTGQRVDPEHADLGGHALLFENVEGSRFPVAINVFGSYHRMEMALGCHEEGHTPGGFEAIAGRIAELTKPEPPASLGDLIVKARHLAPLLRIPPKRRRRGICQEVVLTGSAINLLELPIIKCWPLDGNLEAVGYPTPAGQPDTSPGQGRFITFAGMHTIHADDAGRPRPPSRNIGMYRAQVIDRTRLAMHWHVHHDGARHWRSWKRRGEPMPIAIVLGGESVLPYAATAPLPPGMSELLMAGFLNRGGIPLVRCRTVPLDVPANAEIVIEGFVSTDAGFCGYDPRTTNDPIGPGAVFEGPFGDHTGFYSLPDRYPIMEVTAITHRRHAVYPTTIVGLPPQEDYYLGKATERLFLPLLRTLIPDIEDYDLPFFGTFHNCAFLKIRKEYALQGRRVMHAVWGAGQMAWTKMLVVVDKDVNVHRLDEVMSAIFEHCHFGRDVETVHGPLDVLDHAAPHLGAGTKIGFDATRKRNGEAIAGIAFDAPIDRRREPKAVEDSMRALGGVVDVFVPAWSRGRAALVSLDLDRIDSGRAWLERMFNAGAAPDFVIVVNGKVNVRDPETTLFYLCANVDPGRDAIRIDGRIGFDATSKRAGSTIPGWPVRDFPPVLDMDARVRDRVAARWEELGLA